MADPDQGFEGTSRSPTEPYALVKRLALCRRWHCWLFQWINFFPCLIRRLGLVIGVTVYLSARRQFAPEEEVALSRRFGTAWADYCHRVRMPSRL